MANTQILEEKQQVFNVLRVFLQGSSFEFPQATRVHQPQLENIALQMHVNVAVNEIDRMQRAVSVRVSLTGAGQDGDKKFILETTYAGIFEVAGLSADAEEALLNVACPAIIYPYLRAAVSDSMLRAMLPPFFLPEINWAMLHASTKTKSPVELMPAPLLTQ
jgi:preprotein translocase subunit SecB